VCSNAVPHVLGRYGNAVVDRAKSTKASYVEKPELIQPVEKKGERVSSITLITVGPKSIGLHKLHWTTQTTKRNENNMLDHRFSVAPMMDWNGTSRKTKRSQHLSRTSVRDVVPNEVPRC
jgi:hypothetical protein